MPISIIRPRKAGVPNNFKEGGFTLLEILIALLLVSVVLAIVTIGTSGDHEALEETLETIERAVRFGTDEAALKNSIVRINLLIDREPQEYALEFGPDDTFVVPVIDYDPGRASTLADQERVKKQLKELDNKFSKVAEFQEGNRQLDEKVRIIGVGLTAYENLLTDFPASLYIYPTGEKDDAIIIVGTRKMIAALYIDTFSMEIGRDYITIKEDLDQEQLEERQLEIAKELYQKWRKE